MKRPALQEKWVAVLPVASRARKICETFEKRTPRAEEGKVIATKYNKCQVSFSQASEKSLKAHLHDIHFWHGTCKLWHAGQ